MGHWFWQYEKWWLNEVILTMFWLITWPKISISDCMQSCLLSILQNNCIRVSVNLYKCLLNLSSFSKEVYEKFWRAPQGTCLSSAKVENFGLKECVTLLLALLLNSITIVVDTMMIPSKSFLTNFWNLMQIKTSWFIDFVILFLVEGGGWKNEKLCLLCS